MRIVLHIGMHKTASTTIQKRLKINNQLLKKHGYFYAKRERKALLQAAYDQNFKPWQELIQRAHKSDLVPIVSHESFSHILCRTKNSKNSNKISHIGHWLFNKLEKNGIKVTVIGFIRDQPSYLNSRYTQHVKRFATSESFPDYAAKALKSNIQKTSCNPEQLFDWLNDHPSSQIFLYPYGRSITPPQSLHDAPNDPFMQLIHCLKIPISTEFKPIRDLNIQPGNLGIHAALTLSRESRDKETLKGRTAKRARALICKEAEQRNWAKRPYIGLNPELNRRIRDHFAAANNRFAQRVWGCQWDQIFTAEHLEEPRNLTIAERDEVHQAIKRIRRRLFPTRTIRDAIRNVVDASQTN